MKPVMYIFANRGLGMSPGKLAAQVAHAAVEAYNLSDQRMVEAWYVGGHYTKLIMLARDTQHLFTIDRYLMDRGLVAQLIIDEGLTEIPPHTPTALGVQIVDKDNPDIQATFSSFQLYKEEKLPKPVVKKRRFGRG